MYRDDLNPGDVLDLKFTTVNASGVPTTLAGTPAVSVYKDNGTTESTAGVTLTVDFDARTGLNHLRVDTSADGTFYAAGSNFQAVITAGTVGGTSVVGYIIAEFSIQKRSALRPTTAGRTLDVSAGGEAGVDWANVGAPTTTVGLSGTTVKTATDVETDTQDLQARTPAALVGGRTDANVGAIAGNTDAPSFLDRSARSMVKVTVGAASTTTSIVTSSLDPAASVTDQFKGRVILFDKDTTTAALRGQGTDITANTSGGVLTCTALTTAPVSGDTAVIV